jgi:putative ABC transport system permease protein
VTERTRELGLLRAVGLKRRWVALMITLEAVIVAIYGAFVGLLLGASLAVAVTIALKDLGPSMVSIPWLLLGVYFVASIVAVLIAAALPARRASKLDILEAVTTE